MLKKTVALLLNIFALCILAGTSLASSSTTVPPDFLNETFISGLFQPTALAWAPDGRIFVTEKDGRVRIVQDGVLLTEPFIDLTDETNYRVDRGLVGLALHPDFPATPYVYLYYAYDPVGVVKDGDGARVSRLLRVSADPDNPNKALAGSEVVLLGTNSTRQSIGNETSYEDITHPSCQSGDVPVPDCLPADAPTHMGGGLRFAKDGSLYVGVGDGSHFTFVDPRAIRAQNLDSPAGKVLRINPLTGSGYPDNPYYDGDATHDRSKVWSYGLRNPFRLAINPENNHIYVSKLASGDWEEIFSGAGNYGWPCYRGTPNGNIQNPAYQNNSVCQSLYAQGSNVIRTSLFGYSFNGRDSAVIIGEVYPGGSFPEIFKGALFFGDYLYDWIKFLKFDANGVPTMYDFATQITSGRGLVHITVGPDSNLYYLNFDWHSAGSIDRIRYVGGANSAPTAHASATPNNGVAPLAVHFTGSGSTDPEALPLRYQWDFADGSTALIANPTYTYTVAGVYSATLTITDSANLTDSQHVTIYVGNSAPHASITSVSNAGHYRIGDLIQFSGVATDTQDSVIPESSLSWAVAIHHGAHIHENFYTAIGGSSSFTATDHADNTWLELCMTATDSGGLTDHTCTNLVPDTIAYHFDTQPSGLQLNFGDQTYSTPFTIHPIINSIRTIGALTPQSSYTFSQWSDQGSASHEIVIGSQSQRFTATYARTVWLPLVSR